MIVGYARVSTSEQSLDRQRDDLFAAGAEKVYEEVGSGKKGAKRPELEKLLSEILREGDTLTVTELSRLGRSTGAVIALADDLAERKIGLRVLNLGTDITTPAGKAVYGIIAVIAEMERNLLIERTNSGLAAARARGRKGGRRTTITKAEITKAQKLYDKRELSVSDIAAVIKVSPRTLYRYIVIDGHKSAESEV
jgi:DNA invertase Pin-like site-specific DNA recombinase